MRARSCELVFDAVEILSRRWRNTSNQILALAGFIAALDRDALVRPVRGADSNKSPDSLPIIASRTNGIGGPPKTGRHCGKRSNLRALLGTPSSPRAASGSISLPMV